jgi:hypothetical protein
LQFKTLGVDASQDKSWVDPLVGLTLRFSLEVGYRWLDIDYSTGDGSERFAYDVLAQGPIGGLAFRF